MDQELKVVIAGSVEQFHRDELIEKEAGLDIDPLMELLIEEEGDHQEEMVTAADGALESALAASKDLVPEGELDSPRTATETGI